MTRGHSSDAVQPCECNACKYRRDFYDVYRLVREVDMSGESTLHRKMYYLDVSLLVHSLFRHVDVTAASPQKITYTCDSLGL